MEHVVVNSEKKEGEGDYFTGCRETKFKCDKLALRTWCKNYIIRKKNHLVTHDNKIMKYAIINKVALNELFLNSHGDD